MNRTRGSKVSTTRWYNDASTALNRVLPSLNYDFANNRYATNEIITNKLTYSQDFDNAGWNKTRLSVTPNTTLAPDGTMTADSLIEDSSAASTHALTLPSFTGPAAIGDALTISIYVKANGRSAIQINIPTAIIATSTSCVFNLSTGATTNTGSVLYSDIIPLANGWWRCSLTAIATAAAGLGDVLFYLHNLTSNSYDGDGVSGLYIWGAQIEFSAALGKYVPTTSAAVTTDFGMADTVKPFYSTRLSNATMINSTGNLVYAPANMILQSQSHDVTPWARSGIATVTNGFTAPDGTPTACKMVESAASSLHTLTQAVTLVAGQNYLYTTYLKAAERTHAFIALSGGGFATTAINIDLITGTVATVTGTTLATSIASAGNGWWRVGVNLGSTSAVSGSVINYVGGDGVTWADRTYLGDGTSGILIWGSQFEYNDTSSPTSYYPTYTAQYYGPRFEYSPLTLEARGILNEEARTNIISDNRPLAASYTGSFVTFAETGTILGNPAVTMTTNGAGSQFFYPASSTFAASTIYTSSMVFKKGTHSRVQLTATNNAFLPLVADAYCNYNFDTDTLVVGGSSLPAPTGGRILHADGSVRIWITFTTGTVPTAGSGAIVAFIDTDAATRLAGTATVGATVTAAFPQLEAGAFQTSVIPTTGVAATRAVDNCYTYNTGWYSEVGTFVVDYVPTEDRSQVRRLVAMLPVTGLSDINAAASNTAGRFQILSASGGGATDFGASTGSSTANNYVSNKGSILVNGANGKVVLNGGAVTNDAARAIPVAGVTQKMAIGMFEASTSRVSGYYVRSIKFYKDASASDLQLQAITV